MQQRISVPKTAATPRLNHPKLKSRMNGQLVCSAGVLHPTTVPGMQGPPYLAARLAQDRAPGYQTAAKPAFDSWGLLYQAANVWSWAAQFTQSGMHTLTCHAVPCHGPPCLLYAMPCHAM